MIDIPEQPRTCTRSASAAGYRRWATAPTTTAHTLLIINEADGAWTIHGLGALGVRLTKDVMVTLAESILRPTR